jgi:hypothetical protein
VDQAQRAGALAPSMQARAVASLAAWPAGSQSPSSCISITKDPPGAWQADALGASACTRATPAKAAASSRPTSRTRTVRRMVLSR